MPKPGAWHHLEDRLIGLAYAVCLLTDRLPRTALASHIAGQLLRSGTSAAPNYAEAQSAESRNDFIHRMSICLKELRETHVWLELCRRLELVDAGELERAVEETNELIAIFMASIKTARKNGEKRATKTQ
ncbi:MAG TPA: four helix bundle protein [Gemmatimonadales bacterium]|nr:four helix bundle protein [Gemmatimonadales bacterium]